MKNKHCTNCNNFTWWDGDYCCVAKMKVIEESENGFFWCPFPQQYQTSFIAEECAEYVPVNGEGIYEEGYNEFLKLLKDNNDENLTIEEYREKYYETTKPTDE